jgi:hypothetical protein
VDDGQARAVTARKRQSKKGCLLKPSTVEESVLRKCTHNRVGIAFSYF